MSVGYFRQVLYCVQYIYIYVYLYYRKFVLSFQKCLEYALNISTATGKIRLVSYSKWMI